MIPISEGASAKPVADVGLTSANDRGYTNAGDRASRELGCWKPPPLSGDGATLNDRHTINGRAQDLRRNNGYASGAVKSLRDRVVGGRYRLVMTPSHVSLGLTYQQAREWSVQVESLFAPWAEDPECFADAERKRTFTGLLRHTVGDMATFGEAFLSREWRNSPHGIKTCFLPVDPTRISNPGFITQDTERLRGGIEIDEYGAAVAYHIRKGHPTDWNWGAFLSNKSNWQRVPKYSKFGELDLIHVFEPEYSGSSRGVSEFLSIIRTMKMLDRFNTNELEKNTLGVLYGMYITSQYPPENVLAALGMGSSDGKALLEKYFSMIGSLAKARGTEFDGVRVPVLTPGEDVKEINANRADANSESFKDSVNQEIARGLHTSKETHTGDFSQTSYASARMSNELDQIYIEGRRAVGVNRAATMMLRAWMREMVLRGKLKTPGSIDYFENEAALSACRWIGAGSPQVDLVKTMDAIERGIQNRVMSRLSGCAMLGEDWQETADQLAIEQAYFKDRGLSEGQRTQSQQITVDTSN